LQAAGSKQAQDLSDLTATHPQGPSSLILNDLLTCSIGNRVNAPWPASLLGDCGSPACLACLPTEQFLLHFVGKIGQ
jgi:hypothetical protein